MRRLRSLLIRFTGLFTKSRREKELANEIETNLELQIEDSVRGGMTREEATRAALVKFGGIDVAKEAVRDRRSISLVETTLRDVRYALRAMRQNKGWSAVAILSLALGIGVNTALFSVVNSVLLQTLPVRNPYELISLRWVGQTNMSTGRSGYGYLAPDREISNADPRFRDASFSFGVFQQLRAEGRQFAELFAFAPISRLNVSVNGQAELASGQIVSGNFYRALGVTPVGGRTIQPDDDSAAAAPIAVISYQYWQRRFGMDAAVVGSPITINTAAFTIVGIAPAEIGSMTRIGNDAPDVSIALAMEPRIQRNQPRVSQPANWWLAVMGRLQPKITAAQLQAALVPVYDRTVKEEWKTAFAGFPPERRAAPEIAQHQDRVADLRVVPASHGVYDVVPQESRMLKLLTGIVGMVLLLVCVNLANLLLSRGEMRQKEITLRLAIGASRARLIRQLLTESLVLAGIGGAIGLVTAYVCRTVFPVWMGFRPVEVDFAVLGFSSVVTVLVGILFGLLPAVRATRIGFAPAVGQGAWQSNRSRTRLSKSLLVVQVALSLVLLIGAGLFLKTLRNLKGLDVGFNIDNIVLFGVNPAANQYDAARTASLLEQSREQLTAIPGVRSVALSSTALLTGDNSTSRFGIEGRSDRVESYVLSVDHNYFNTIEIPLRLGRQFTPQDNAAGPRVAVVNEAFARKFFPDKNPIGMHVTVPNNIQIEIIGVMGDARFASLRDDPPPTVYMPQLQRPTGRYFAIRTAGDAASFIPAIRTAMRRADPALPLQFISTQTESIDRLLTWERTFALSSTLFGVLALVISMIGLFGLMSYTVARRTKEIGIRMAIGARRAEVLRSVLRETLLLVAMGIIIGVAASLYLTRFIAAQLFGLAPHDPVSISLAVMLMIAVATLAGYLPARRAARVDPMVALRYE